MNITRSHVWTALAIVGAAVAALLLNRLIVSDKQRVERTVRAMADAATKGDIDLLFSHVSADYHDEVMSRDDLRALADSYFGPGTAVQPKIQRMSVTVSGTLARVEMTITGSVDIQGYRGPLGTWEFAAEFHKEPDRTWRMTSVTPLRRDGTEIPGWRDLRRGGY